MLSIVKVLGSIISDVMFIPGKAKNILKVGSMTEHDWFGDFKDIILIEIHCVSIERIKEAGWEDGQNPDAEGLCVL